MIRRLKPSGSENDDLGDMVTVIRGDFGPGHVSGSHPLPDDVDGGPLAALARAILSPCTIDDGRAERSTVTRGHREASEAEMVRAGLYTFPISR